MIFRKKGLEVQLAEDTLLYRQIWGSVVTTNPEVVHP